MSYTIRKALKEYIEEIINYHYNLNDKGHGLEHAEYVINRSFQWKSRDNCQVDSIFEKGYFIIKK